jgi:hypothetical protein
MKIIVELKKNIITFSFESQFWNHPAEVNQSKGNVILEFDK